MKSSQNAQMNITHLCSGTTYIKNTTSPYVDMFAFWGCWRGVSILNIWSAFEYFDQHCVRLSSQVWPEKQLRLRDKIGVSCFCIIIYSTWTARKVPFHSVVFMKDKGFVTAHHLDGI